MRRVMFALLVALATPLALLTSPAFNAPAGAVTRAKPKPTPPPAPVSRHVMSQIALSEIHALVSDARSRGVGVVTLRAEWQRVAICEVDGNWSMVGPSYSGIGFQNGTWDEYGGTRYAPVAGRAGEDAQIVIGMRVTGGWVPDQTGCDPGGW
ncbi:MAG: transglycosylase family protein [Acidimicrobiales bacterium]